MAQALVTGGLGADAADADGEGVGRGVLTATGDETRERGGEVMAVVAHAVMIRAAMTAAPLMATRFAISDVAAARGTATLSALFWQPWRL